MPTSFLKISSDHPFSIQNLPYGVFSRLYDTQKHIGVAVGDWILDLTLLEQKGGFKTIVQEDTPLFQSATLNTFMSKGKDTWKAVREHLQAVLQNLDRHEALCEDVTLWVKQTEATMHLPAEIRNYTDFYASRAHAENVGAMFRGKENALLPNWLHQPIAYHGRASSIVVSGTPIKLPKGQFLTNDSPNPIFDYSRKMDFEVELGFIVGVGNELGTSIAVENAEDHVFGAVLVNDWSARDIQQWEYQPLGPFLGKNFATAISPWVIPMAALKPFETFPLQFEKSLLPYLHESNPYQFDMDIDVFFSYENATSEMKIASTNTSNLYWTYRQMVAHHTINGCNLQTGDLLATGTISGHMKGSYGSLLECTLNGTEAIHLQDGRKLTYLQVGDSIEMQGAAKKSHFNVGFGSVKNYITI